VLTVKFPDAEGEKRQTLHRRRVVDERQTHGLTGKGGGVVYGRARVQIWNENLERKRQF